MDDDIFAGLRAQLRARGLDREPAGEWDRVESPEAAAERRHRQQANRLSRWLAHRPVIYEGAALDNLTPGQAPGRLRSWLHSAESTHLLLVGAPGTGKTYAAYALGAAAVEMGLVVEAWTATDLLNEARPGGSSSVTAYVRTCDLLILDDLDAARPSEWAIEYMTALFDARLRDGLRTVVTVNAGVEQMVEAWGERLIDRLMYRMVPLRFTGTSRRRQAW